jgi:hypothetical protein
MIYASLPNDASEPMRQAKSSTNLRMLGLIATVALSTPLVGHESNAGKSNPTLLEFPLGTATPSEECGACHEAIYREFAYGFGADLQLYDALFEYVRQLLKDQQQS